MNTNDIGLLIDQALAQRPDIAAQRASAQAKEAAVRSARSDLWPSLNAGASAQANRHNYSEDTETLNDNDYTVMAYLAVQWKFFDGFLLLNKKRAAEAAYEAEKAKLKAAEIGASADVWTMYYNLQTALKKMSSAKALLSSSEASYELALESYKAGLSSLLDLLQSQNKLADARNKTVSAHKDLLNAQAGLIHALGLLFTEDSNTLK